MKFATQDEVTKQYVVFWNLIYGERIEQKCDNSKKKKQYCCKRIKNKYCGAILYDLYVFNAL